MLFVEVTLNKAWKPQKALFVAGGFKIPSSQIVHGRFFNAHVTSKDIWLKCGLHDVRVLSVLQLLRWHCRKAPRISAFKEADNAGLNLYDKTLSTRKPRAILSIRTFKKYEK